MPQTLFNYEAPQAALARPSDPATSHDSASEISDKLGLLQLRLVSVIERLGPMTALEAATECQREFGGMAESYRKRATECHRRHALEIEGVRACRVSGKSATVYRVADTGRNIKH